MQSEAFVVLDALILFASKFGEKYVKYGKPLIKVDKAQSKIIPIQYIFLNEYISNEELMKIISFDKLSEIQKQQKPILETEVIGNKVKLE